MSEAGAVNSVSLKQTPLFAFHRDLNARIVDFAGYQMPVQYPSGIIKEHDHTRSKAGLFDISHMGQAVIRGDRTAEVLEGLLPSDICGLGLNRQRYTVITNDQGGIMDDCMVTSRGDHFFIVVNASRKREVFQYLRSRLPQSSVFELEEFALLAVQGPESSRVLDRFVPGVSRLPFMSCLEFSMDGVGGLVSRCGYTGEDGYELSIRGDKVEALVHGLVAEPEVMPVGLGARDSLRLEAGLCLYGHDIDESTSPIEAGLGWVVARKYIKADGEKAFFPGAERILRELETGVHRKRVGIKPDGRALVREGAELLSETGDTVGRITSGGFGPTVEGPVAMGYVRSDFTEIGTKLTARIRGRLRPVAVVDLPFVAHRYFKH